MVTTVSAEDARSAPANDAFANSATLVGSNVVVMGTCAGASLEPGENKVFTNNAGSTVWYSWTAPFLASVFVRTESLYTYKSFGVFVGNSVDDLDLIATANVFLAFPGTTYHFQIDGSSAVAGEFRFILAATHMGSATNDNFADAIQIDGVWAMSRDSVAGASLEPGEPVHRSGPSKSIWWKWTAPGSGNTEVYHGQSTATNITLAVYVGNSVDALTALTNGPHVTFVASAGHTYYIAAAVAAETSGDVLLNVSQGPRLIGFPVLANLLCQPGFENTSLNLTCWQVDAPIGGSVNVGSTIASISAGGTIWQTVATIPGEEYEVSFAFAGAGALLHVSLNSHVMGIAEIPPDDSSWHRRTFSVVATEPTSTLKFTVIRPWEYGTGNVAFDDASLVRKTEPPTILTQPKSLSATEGGTAVFTVGIRGSPPLFFQWFFNDVPLPEAKSQTLILQSVTPDQAGQYSVSVSNAFGVVTSTSATLHVETNSVPVIVLQPQGDTIPNGGYHVLTVAALGAPPLHYEWLKDGTPVPEGTNRHLVFAAISPNDSGTYTVTVSNDQGSVRSLPANLRVTETNQGGALVRFENRFSNGLEAPVFDVDATTRLSGSNFLAQLYAGPTAEWMRAAGSPVPFRTGAFSGFFASRTVSIPNVPPVTPAFVQVRAWEAARGASYEEARALGGKFGRSDILLVATGGVPSTGLPVPPGSLAALQSFHLEAGQPLFNVGVIRLEDRLPNGVLVWYLQGEPGFRYSIERQIGTSDWAPLLVITNVAGSTTFIDDDSPPQGRVLYRSRILD